MTKKLFGAVAVVAVVVGAVSGRLSARSQLKGLEASLAEAQRATRYVCDYTYTEDKIIDGCESVYQRHILEGGPGALIGFASEIHGKGARVAFVKGGNEYAYYPARRSFLASGQTARAEVAYAPEKESSLGDFVDQHDGEGQTKVIAPSSGSGPDGVLPGPRYNGDTPAGDEGEQLPPKSDVGLLDRFFGGDGLPSKEGEPSGKKPAS
jgi:hypothetical protein